MAEEEKQEEKQQPTLRTTPADEGKLIEVLKSDASRKEKADACRELSRYSTQASVETLIGMVSDPEMAHMARYALETNPDPGVDAGLRAALGNLDGLLLVGVIGSVGVRRDAEAVGAVAGHLKSNDAQVVQAAARSLGNIGTQEAADALDGALTGSSGETQLAICEGLLRCAERFMATSGNGQAAAIYDRLSKIRGPHQVRTAAERGVQISSV
jgi:HEAT repeat protein